MRGVQNRFTDGSDHSDTGRERRGLVVTPALVVGMIAGMAIVIMVASALVPDRADEPVDTAVQADATATSSAPTEEATPSPRPAEQAASEPPVQGDDHDHETDPEAAAAAARIAGRFVDAWLLRKGADARAEAMKPYATNGLVQAVANADLTRIPNADRTGKPRQVAMGEYQGAFQIELDNGDEVEVVVVSSGAGWRASEISPVE